MRRLAQPSRNVFFCYGFRCFFSFLLISTHLKNKKERKKIRSPLKNHLCFLGVWSWLSCTYPLTSSRVAFSSPKTCICGIKWRGFVSLYQPGSKSINQQVSFIVKKDWFDWFFWKLNLRYIAWAGGKLGGGSGLLKLQDDVKMCGYEDVQVMWNLLNTSQIKQIGSAAADSHQSPKCSKRWPSWITFFWPNQRATASSSSSSSFRWFKSS